MILHSLQHVEGPQSVQVFLSICHWIFLVPNTAFNRGKGIWDLLDSFLLLFSFELVLLPVHWPSGLRALPEVLRCVLPFSYSLPKPDTLFWFLCLLRFLSPCLSWKNLVLLESSQVSRPCWWFWFLLEHLKSEDVSLKLKKLKAGCENKDDAQKARRAWPDCSCWVWESYREIWMALGKADSALYWWVRDQNLSLVWDFWDQWLGLAVEFYFSEVGIQLCSSFVFPQCFAQPTAEHFHS